MEQSNYNHYKNKKIMTYNKEQSKELLNKTFYDCRYEDYYTVTAYDVTGHFLTLEYKKLGTKKEAVSFVNYHIEQQQHLPKK